jgi:hypothetical protein
MGPQIIEAVKKIFQCVWHCLCYELIMAKLFLKLIWIIVVLTYVVDTSKGIWLRCSW